MSDGKRSTADPEDLAEAPFLDDLERAESAWLIARDEDPTAPAPTPAIQRDYAELEDLLGNLPPVAENDGWQDEVLRRATAPVSEAVAALEAPAPAVATMVRPRRSRRASWWAAVGVIVAAAALAVVVLRPRSRPPADELEIELRRGDQVRGDAQEHAVGGHLVIREAAVGDHLVIRGRSLETGDLRVFRADGALVGRCPEGPGCTIEADGSRSLEVTLDRPVPYRLILVTRLTGNLPGATRDEYLEALRAANAHIEKEAQIHVH
ncbi:MAG TPA: hypothetical protein VN253_01705 [Kofleriaceae bacterium]|nr:hypothetical protein [Kofleriaceae bacterium]